MAIQPIRGTNETHARSSTPLIGRSQNKQVLAKSTAQSHFLVQGWLQIPEGEAEGEAYVATSGLELVLWSG